MLEGLELELSKAGKTPSCLQEDKLGSRWSSACKSPGSVMKAAALLEPSSTAPSLHLSLSLSLLLLLLVVSRRDPQQSFTAGIQATENCSH